MRQALQIGNDVALMQSRTGLFASAGLQVCNLAGRSEADDALPALHWDVAILCHTLSEPECTALVAALRRRNPQAPILLIARRNDTMPAHAGQVDSVLSASPARMIPALRAILENLAKQKQEEEKDAAEAAG